jgi:hypothetical protein
MKRNKKRPNFFEPGHTPDTDRIESGTRALMGSLPSRKGKDLSFRAIREATAEVRTQAAKEARGE